LPTFSDAEKAAMKERAREQREFKKLSGEEQVRVKIADMNPHEKKIAQGIHDLVTSIDERLKVVCFFQAGSKFESRYSTFGFQEQAKLDDGDMFATSFAVIDFTPKVAEQISKLVRKAVGK
jgi:uncharacterized protein YdhG (YjbR/CyaY superfamily)